MSRNERDSELFVRHIITGMSQGGQVGDFIIAQISDLGDILDLWAIKFVNKNALKAQISGFGRYFFLDLCSKVRFLGDIRLQVGDIWSLSTWPPW